MEENSFAQTAGSLGAKGICQQQAKDYHEKNEEHSLCESSGYTDDSYESQNRS